MDRKESLFTRFKKTQDEKAKEPSGLTGINDDELEEFREAFRLFDRVSSLDCFQLLICFS
jgi:hypothetical protein